MIPEKMSAQAEKGEYAMKRRSFLYTAMILLSVLLLTGCEDVAEPVDSVTKITEGVSVLELEIGAADVHVREGEQFRVETDNPFIKVTLRNGVLTLREEPHAADLESSKLVIEYPAGTSFREVEMDLGAGRLEIDALICGELDLDLGAGKTEIHSLTVTDSADISGGAGEILIHSGEIRNLDLELGVGSGVITALLTGSAEIDAGVGNLELNIPAPETDYTMKVTTGLGGVYLDGQLVRNGTHGTGPNKIKVSGGIGKVVVVFGTV